MSTENAIEQIPGGVIPVKDDVSPEGWGGNSVGEGWDDIGDGGTRA